MADVYSYSDYKAFLKVEIAENRGIRGYRARLARAAGCGLSFLSQVVHGASHLSPDQAVGIAEIVAPEGRAREYFMDLVTLARCATRAGRTLYRKRLQAALAQVVQEARSPGPTPAGASAGLERVLAESWQPVAIHAALSIPECRTDEQLARRLGLRVEVVRAWLAELEAAGAVRREGGGRWLYSREKIDLALNSRAARRSAANWAGYAQERMRGPALGVGAGGFHSMTFTYDADSVLELAQAQSKFIAEARGISAAAKPEDVYSVMVWHLKL